VDDANDSGLNHRRYAINDETLYVAPSDKRTDYSQPPMNNFYYGVLNTGRRRYAHPALSGSLPQPWLPAIDRPRAFGDGAKERRGIVLSLRRKKGKMLRRSQAELLDPVEDTGEDGGEMPEGWSTGDILRDGSTRPSDAIGYPEDESSEGARRQDTSTSNLSASSSANPWGEPSPSPAVFGQVPRKKVSTGIFGMPDEGNVWDDSASASEGEEGHHQDSPVSVLLPSDSMGANDSRHTSIIPRDVGRIPVMGMQDQVCLLLGSQSSIASYLMAYAHACRVGLGSHR
jgi:hypothetical protein